MNINELSDSFDVLLNSYASQSIYGTDTTHTNVVCDEYEKSVFLTEALYELVVSLYNGGTNLEGFESSEENRAYLNKLVVTTSQDITSEESKEYKIQLPDNLLFLLHESAIINVKSCGNIRELEIFPVTLDEYNKIRNNPFQGANDFRVLRLDTGEENSNRTITLITKYPINKYKYSYLRMPNPILLVTLTGDLYIGEKQEKSGSIDLPPIMHSTLLRMAVQKAILSKGLNQQKVSKGTDDKS